MLTTVVGERQNGGELTLAVLGDDPKTGEGALLAGNVKSCVPTVIGQLWIAAGFQEFLYQVWLVCDDC